MFAQLILLLALIAAVAVFGEQHLRTESTSGSIPCTGCTDICTLLAPQPTPICYQGAPADAVKCFNTDPLLPAGSTWQCNSCASIGYTEYSRNDPIYKNMELWTQPKK